GDRDSDEPGYEDSIEAIAKSTGRDATELLYDRMLERDGRELFLVPVLNYSELTADPIREMMYHPRASLGLGDGGAHCGVICDASIQTFMLTHWVRDRRRGARIPVEFAVQRPAVRPARPRHARGGQEGRRERDRPRWPAPAAAGNGLRPARGREAIHAAGEGISRDDRVGRDRARAR